MRIALERRRSPATDTEPFVVEVVTPRTNCAALTSAENFFASMALSEPFSVEIAADSSSRRFLVRSASAQMHQQLMSQLSAAYPQAELRTIGPHDDPAVPRAGEQSMACTLALRAPAYLPLRTFTDLDVDGERAAQADPVLGILTALGDLPVGWRGLSQLVLTPAPENWCRDFQRFSVQHPLEHERVARTNGTAVPTLVFGALLLFIALLGLQAYRLIRAEAWLQVLGLVATALVGLGGALLAVRWLGRTRVYDMELVREKVTRIAHRAEVRLVTFAPPESPPAATRGQLDRLAAAYRRFNLAAANGFEPRRVAPRRVRTRLPTPWGAPRTLPVLTTLELAGVWHLPHSAADVALLERTTARHWLPLPPAVAEGCRIGLSRHQGREVPVALPADTLRRHALLVAKTRRGKSTLMQRLAHFSMQAQPRRAVLLVDPHRDLAEATLGLVPPERGADVVFLDVANRNRPFGLNLLDTGLGWDRDRAVANALTIFQREWGDRYWGPRMEDAFRYSLLSLFEANVAKCRADPTNGRAMQYTLLDVPTVLSDKVFRSQVLEGVDDPSIRAWWSDYFEPLDRRFQLELINPVLTKVHRFEGSTAARHIVGQPASTIDPSAWLRDGGIVIVNTARGTVGDNAAALIGSTLLNLVTLAVAEQASLQASNRWPISIFIDEFHTIPGADYEAILAELSKYGANLVLATQSLARLLALGRDDGQGLRATVFANIDGLFAFNCSALPTFSVQLDPPLVDDPRLGKALARASADRYGRDAEHVEAARRIAVERVLEARTKRLTSPPAAQPTKPPARNEHRPRKKPRPQPEGVSA